MTFKQINLFDILGLTRLDDLLFRCRSDLKGKVTDVETVKENCSKCGRDFIFAWHFTQDGQRKSYRVSSICTGCLNGQETKKITNEAIEMKKQAVLSKWYHIPDNDNSGFKNYQVISKATEKAKTEAMNYTKLILSGKLDVNLLLMGSTGTGKSHLARTISKTAKEKGLNVAYIEAVELFNLIKATFGHDRHNKMLFDEYQSFDLVVIDDVGLETKKLGEVNWTVAEWTKLVDTREGKATVFTTNFDDVALAEVIGKRAFSRMYMNTIFIDLFTEDFRKKLMV